MINLSFLHFGAFCLLFSAFALTGIGQILSPDTITTCQGDTAKLMCQVSSEHIIIWISDEYIGSDGNQLEFGLQSDGIGQNKTSKVDPNTVATFIGPNESDSEMVVSQLQIKVNETGIIECRDGTSGTSVSSTINLISDPGMPQTRAYQTKDATGNCTVHISWNSPANIAIGDVSYFVVKINDTNVKNKIYPDNNTLLFAYYPVCSCGDHSIDIAAVNRCGHVGQFNHVVVSSSNLSLFRNDPVCDNGTTNNSTGNGMNNGSTYVAAITLSTIVVVSLIICSVNMQEGEK